MEKKKIADLKSLFELCSSDIIQGTETWLVPNIQTSEFIPHCYITNRKDRKTDKHGGVLLSHKRDLIIMHRQEYDSDCEILWNQMEIKYRRPLLTGTSYKPRCCERTWKNP